ncbi:MAG: CTP synthase [Candidatus Marinimicrobia bacterium]|nr:CTP synthase [Candidatus Neomarinimicrobiota bacterium]
MFATKYIFVTGGVISGIGKGIAAASIAYLLKESGYRVTIQKFDPYINVDPGTMSPFQHGEVFVTNDGSETDLDLGHYERFLNQDMGKANNATTGQIYYEVIKKERRGDYLGATIQVIPHITDEIISLIKRETDNSEYDFIITEVGGTVGDIESLPYLEAIRQFELLYGRENCLNIHVTMIPFIKVTGEVKTKPTQHSVQKLREIGIQPEVLICRSEYPMIDASIQKKIGLFCNISPTHVIEAYDASSIYEVPLILHKHGILEILTKKFNLEVPNEFDPTELKSKVNTILYPSHSVIIAVVGKYTVLLDAYKSIMESFIHAGIENDVKVNLKFIEAEDLEISNHERIKANFDGIDGILIPGGFGERGIEGKLSAIRVARENNIPFFGICLGLQTAVIEFARNVMGLEGANSTEFDKKTPHPVIELLNDQVGVTQKGGTMRLGVYKCELQKNSKAYDAYDSEAIHERHRHRYEVNNDYRDKLMEAGMLVSGKNSTLDLVEIIELLDHPWFVAVQFHPEFKSRLSSAHPLFRDFVKASLENKKNLNVL